MKPSKNLPKLLAICFLPALAYILLPEAGLLWTLVLSGILVAALLDTILLYRLPKPTLERQVSGALPMGVASGVHIHIENSGRKPLDLEIYDHYPANMRHKGLPIRVIAEPGMRTSREYTIYPNERGNYLFDQARVLIRSPFKLWYRCLRLGEEEEVKVYPNFRELANYNLLAGSRHLGLMGIRKRRKRGEGLEFHQLREYVQGDAVRQIDWKATARMKKLISREYREEQDQRVIFMLDCGQSMRAKDEELGHFDHALNTILLLSQVALKQGDSVGLTTFAGTERHLGPRKGLAQLNLILNTTYDILPSNKSADYITAAETVMARFRKRALVVLITNFRDEDEAQLLPAVQMMRKRHLVLVAGIREPILKHRLETPIFDLEDALMVAGVHRHLERRAKSYGLLTKRGIPALDVEPGSLAVAAVNAYLAIKSSGML